jgi:hypothetical protein
VRLPYTELAGHEWQLRDRTSSTVYQRGGELADQGLYLDLPPWGYHVFQITPAEQMQPNPPQVEPKSRDAPIKKQRTSKSKTTPVQ